MSFDPITFEIIRHRLFRVVDEAVITLKHVSGSAITNEGHDLMVSLYSAKGELLMGGVGFLHHLTSASQACKHIIRNFEGDIFEGDVFLLNDPYTAALHTSDVYLVAPIHYEGELVAWSACFVHVYDIGALNPGGFSPDSTDVFTEGFSSPGIKLVDRGRIRHDVLNTMLNMVRSSEMVALDIRSMIACNNVARERMTELVDKYGVAQVDDACRRLVSQSEERLRARLRELPDGQWQSRQFLELKGERFRVELTMTKTGDELTFDFSGSSPQTAYGVNCAYWAAWGGMFAPIFPLLCYDITWNEGVIRPIRMIAPEGTIVNCTRPAPVSVATVGAIQSVNNASVTCISKMLSASETLADEATAVWHGSHVALFLFGKNQRNEDAIGIMTETFGGAGGARSFADGIDVGGEVPNPISRMANVEQMESEFPVLYLFRRMMPDSGGAGQYRGGMGAEYAIVPHGSPAGGIGFVISGKGITCPMSEGLAGGLPGGPSNYVKVKNVLSGPSNRGPLPASLDEMVGQSERISWGLYGLDADDGLYVRWNGGGGFGDPLAREVAAVETDLRLGAVSADSALRLYGVVADPVSGRVDQAATAERRQQMRDDRLRAEAAE